MKKLFTDRFGQGLPRTKEELDAESRDALWGILSARIAEEWFGCAFNEQCGDGYAYAGTATGRLQRDMAAYKILWPPDQIGANPPATDGQVFDAVEYSYQHVAEPGEPSYHSYMSHSHYGYNQEVGRARFQDDINTLFQRNGLAFELRDGEVTRISPAVLHEALDTAIFQTGDNELDKLLETTREKFLNKSLDVRKEGLEKLWDAWERLKTVEAGKDKKAQATALLDKAAAEQNYRALLETEALELTKIGNSFMIRHTETTKTPINESEHVDYLFHRMFAIVRLLLRKSGRGG
jgi:hypothetical protein